jgi:hypothetical protein
MSPATGRAIGSLCLAAAVLAACGPPPAAYEPPPPPGYASATVITAPPPDLPVYEQPPCPGDGYLWTPGYWAWADGDYYWVPGTWVEAPEPGYLWTPGYWGWGGSAYVFHEGYWGEHVGFYGGVAYGYGYTGHGYEGARWNNGHVEYNQTVNNVNTTIVHNVYNTTVINNNTTNVTRVSYNGGNGGLQDRPTAEEQSADQARHIPPVAAQTQHVATARSNPQLRASANQGKPPIAATAKPGDFSGEGVVAAKEGGAVHNAPAHAENVAARPNTAVHASELTPPRPEAPNTGDPKMDQQYQQEQDKLVAQQTKERQDLQKQQDQDHQKLAQQKADAATTQKLEQQHAQQTQQLAQKHAKQMQDLKAKQTHQGGDKPKR